MTLLDAHLDQIELCSSTISDLPFPGPKIFTNAMLNAPDITALIRDTEAHERALFSLATPIESSRSRRSTAVRSRRETGFAASANDQQYDTPFQAPRPGTAVAAVLGGDLNERIKREYRRDAHEQRGDRKKQKDNIDVELLLQGAEKLCSVYPIPGALERIATLRTRNNKVVASTERYEQLVGEQATQLGRMNRSTSMTFDDDEIDEAAAAEKTQELTIEDLPVTVADLKREQEDIEELERKKQVLEERVSGMEKDLGGLMR